MGLMQSKIATLKTLTSATGSVNELEWKWLSDLNSDTTLTLEGQWLKYLSGLGYTGTVDEMKIASWKALGYSGSINELEEQFWAGGGTYGGDNTLTHIILYGQSLSLGSDTTGSAAVVSSSNPSHKMFNGGVRVHYDTPGLSNENSPLDPAQAASLSTLSEAVSPFAPNFAETFASGIATKLSNTGLFSATGRGAYRAELLDRYSLGSFTGWNHWQNTYASALLGSELARDAGYTYEVGPIIFKQGEADGQVSTPKADWKTTVQGIRDDLAIHLAHATLTDTSDLIMITDQVSLYISSQGYQDIAVGAIELHRAGNGVVCAGPTYQEEFSGNNDNHFTSNTYRNYGERLGLIIEKIRDGETWHPCHITSVSRSTTTITVNVHVPSPPLTTDTTLVASVANSGFTYSGANITDVSITDDGSSDNAGVITITIDADAGGNLGYAYANGTSGWIGATNGSRGNIRDSESAVTDNDSAKLYNWLCVDEWVVA